MSTKRFRLTKAAKILIAIIVMALIGGGVYFGMKTGLIKNSKKKPVDIVSETKAMQTSESVEADDDGNVINTDKDDDKTINLSLDEWIGWKSIIDANGGLSTKEGSIYDKLGIKVNISIINDATQVLLPA